MKSKNVWLGVYVLFTFFVGIILPIVTAFVTHDWIWLVITGLETFLLILGVLAEEKGKHIGH